MLRDHNVTLSAIADNLGVATSTLNKWIKASKGQNSHLSLKSTHQDNSMPNDKRPQDWNPEQQLNLIIQCSSLDENEVNQLCREKGIYPHHINEWKSEFLNAKTSTKSKPQKTEEKALQKEIKSLEKEIRRKDKALAETAALLVLQKKVNALWSDKEDD